MDLHGIEKRIREIRPKLYAMRSSGRKPTQVADIMKRKLLEELYTRNVALLFLRVLRQTSHERNLCLQSHHWWLLSCAWRALVMNWRLNAEASFVAQRFHTANRKIKILRLWGSALHQRKCTRNRLVSATAYRKQCFFFTWAKHYLVRCLRRAQLRLAELAWIRWTQRSTLRKWHDAFHRRQRGQNQHAFSPRNDLHTHFQRLRDLSSRVQQASQRAKHFPPIPPGRSVSNPVRPCGPLLPAPSLAPSSNMSLTEVLLDTERTISRLLERSSESNSALLKPGTLDSTLRSKASQRLDPYIQIRFHTAKLSEACAQRQITRKSAASLRHAWDIWRIRFHSSVLGRLSLAYNAAMGRKRSFYQWRDRYLVRRQWECLAEARWQRHCLSHALQTWAEAYRRNRLRVGLTRWYFRYRTRRSKRLVHEISDTWTCLTLKRAYFTSWLCALASNRERVAQLAVACRTERIFILRHALRLWYARMRVQSALRNVFQQAEERWVARTQEHRDLLRDAFLQWKALATQSLHEAIRFRRTRRLGIAFGKWCTLAQQTRAILQFRQRQQARLVRTSLYSWRLQTRLRFRSTWCAVSDKSLLRKSLRKWREAYIQRCLVRIGTMQRFFRHWRILVWRCTTARADSLHKSALVIRSFASWRACWLNCRARKHYTRKLMMTCFKKLHYHHSRVQNKLTEQLKTFALKRAFRFWLHALRKRQLVTDIRLADKHYGRLLFMRTWRAWKAKTYCVSHKRAQRTVEAQPVPVRSARILLKCFRLWRKWAVAQKRKHISTPDPTKADARDTPSPLLTQQSLHSFGYTEPGENLQRIMQWQQENLRATRLELELLLAARRQDQLLLFSASR
eukprot:TRINITY_DN21329_c0_g1_i1.p1 TRINITY_DN21329_c0_g1~~TRINITY_DN21329_c0_g1_i1.p1  ORF type:complete len:851 (+),score=40.69 TRINITY_DN21329_c0_g1_i1:37-2589(+)